MCRRKVCLLQRDIDLAFFLKKTILHPMRQLFTIIRLGSIFMVMSIVVIFLIIRLESYQYIKINKQLLPKTQTALVLGAGLSKNGKLSPIFKDRIDTAILLYQTKKVETILVSGDDGTTTHNEVNPARDYLLTQGVRDSDIFLDHAGFDTYSSMYRASEVFRVTSAIIVTQSFHLPRSVFIARKLGITAYGIASDQHLYSFKNNIREVFANVKAFLDLFYNRIPKYLGEEIPITGSGYESI